ncbi:hypothetical protein TREES_T100021310 [Tupaia chinensis]|uniref:Uncharacterized protein n=1 Tax=Tupaia chinensis TaxID=246437 RepID=L8Y355_TUPCH|nr:hypothetical protein TREES_T100021310 [Tupaia chinensis]
MTQKLLLGRDFRAQRRPGICRVSPGAGSPACNAAPNLARSWGLPGARGGRPAGDCGARVAGTQEPLRCHSGPPQSSLGSGKPSPGGRRPEPSAQGNLYEPSAARLSMPSEPEQLLRND